MKKLFIKNRKVIIGGALFFCIFIAFLSVLSNHLDTKALEKTIYEMSSLEDYDFQKTISITNSQEKEESYTYAGTRLTSTQEEKSYITSSNSPDVVANINIQDNEATIDAKNLFITISPFLFGDIEDTSYYTSLFAQTIFDETMVFNTNEYALPVWGKEYDWYTSLIDSADKFGINKIISSYSSIENDKIVISNKDLIKVINKIQDTINKNENEIFNHFNHSLQSLSSSLVQADDGYVVFVNRLAKAVSENPDDYKTILIKTINTQLDKFLDNVKQDKTSVVYTAFENNGIYNADLTISGKDNSFVYSVKKNTSYRLTLNDNN